MTVNYAGFTAQEAKFSAREMSAHEPAGELSGRFFCLNIPRAALARAISDCSTRKLKGWSTRPADSREESIILGLKNESPASIRRYESGATAMMLPFPDGMRALVNLALDPTVSEPYCSDKVLVLLPRSNFHELEEKCGTPRLQNFSFKSGAAINDPVLANLGRCLLSSTSESPLQQQFQDQVGSALRLHFAIRFGDMALPKVTVTGGLADWQLKLAMTEIETSLENKLIVEDLAKKCGLSASHFARAFTISTEMPPHRFIMKRRVEKTKLLMRSTSIPLVEIALLCGFSDQSHFNRVFSALVCATPGSWRKNQQQLVLN